MGFNSCDSNRCNSQISLDELFDILSHRHRRAMVECFLDRAENHVFVDEMVTHLVHSERRRTGEQPLHEEIRTALHHVHVPKFSEAGIVSYAEDDVLGYHPDDRLEKLVECIRSEEL